MFSPKEKFYTTPKDIYKPYGGDLEGKPLPKSVDFLDEMGTFEDRMKYATLRGFQVGAFLSSIDIALYTKLTERRAQALRAAYLTIPVMAMATGWMAALEIAKKTFETKKGAYIASALVPAGIMATWRKRPEMFFKSFAPIALIGGMHGYSVDNNLFTGWVPSNPRDPIGGINKETTTLLWPHQREFLYPKGHRGTFMSPVDPGPTYAQFEDKN
eukprot:TRINITY_DN21053_c0_g1_i1.p1 TRINITY_DN21053_c0_g1~~TRINITY_DN21053_c0_g1_i1.p1  ORF type:complete len:214 (-),score=38.72 TRINITY_DN21053_c0_g1_i1:474-1115(-)